MAAAAGIWNQHTAAGQHLAAPTLLNRGATPLTGPGGGNNDNNGSNDNSATISANDFLTLLVTEMQNQDPTEETDPNEYIDQLVQVNSLEQLIDINKNLSTALGTSDTSSSSSSVTTQAIRSAAGLTGSGKTDAPAITHPAAQKNSALGVVQSDAAVEDGTRRTANHARGPQSTSGNLSVPAVKPAAQRVAHALNGRHPAR